MLPESIDVKLFRDVIAAVRVFECQIKFVLVGQYVEALVAVVPETRHVAASAVNVDLDEFLQGAGVLEPVVLGAAIGHEPRHLFRLVLGVVDGDRASLDAGVVVDPLFVRRHELAVRPVRGRPVERVLLADVLRVQRALEHVHYPNLARRPLVSRSAEEI